MDTSREDKSLFDHVMCNISASVDEVTVPGALALDLIEKVPKNVDFYKIIIEVEISAPILVNESMWVIYAFKLYK